MICEAKSNTQKSVSSDIQTLRTWFKKLGCTSFFQLTSQCLNIRWNTLPCVWYITSCSNKCHIVIFFLFHASLKNRVVRSESLRSKRNGEPPRSVFYILAWAFRITINSAFRVTAARSTAIWIWLVKAKCTQHALVTLLANHKTFASTVSWLLVTFSWPPNCSSDITRTLCTSQGITLH